MSRRKEFLSWEEITSIINADDSEIEDFDDSDQSDDDCDVWVLILKI